MDKYFKDEIKRINTTFQTQIEFRDGPLKTYTRALAKVNNDYSNKQYYPKSAYLLDINRCMIITKSCNDLYQYYMLFKKETQFDIIRLKNGFRNFNQKILTYAALKINLII